MLPCSPIFTRRRAAPRSSRWPRSCVSVHRWFATRQNIHMCNPNQFTRPFTQTPLPLPKSNKTKKDAPTTSAAPRAWPRPSRPRPPTPPPRASPPRPCPRSSRLMEKRVGARGWIDDRSDRIRWARPRPTLKRTGGFNQPTTQPNKPTKPNNPHTN